MSDTPQRLTFPVLLGSVRRDRQGIRAARLVVRALEAHGHEAVLVDPLELALPLLDRMYKEYKPGEAPPKLEALAALYRRADGFVIVSGEYNHSIPPALSNLLDHFLEEYFWRPSAIVCYSAGAYGGVRAAVQLRAMLAEIGMSSIPSLMPIPKIASTLDEQGMPSADWVSRSLERFLAELFWYARALKQARAEGPMPY
ncbi:NADPH-dependent FMN reductase [Pararobbsia silviterrae]|uniref:NADPH-dependent oxidoreductase n=1 Tax=Pararobbsia silviterrae TaxID=1792498 RepID=A0A494Y9K3_9BURK|nr:NAD(P)H-dependent oxidoreductase [Pararobbsia silviterrae]RKP59392.1 NADPH-dependent oxidoreductase [Pararobbsia silviterrae]